MIDIRHCNLEVEVQTYFLRDVPGPRSRSVSFYLALFTYLVIHKKNYMYKQRVLAVFLIHLHFI